MFTVLRVRVDISIGLKDGSRHRDGELVCPVREVMEVTQKFFALPESDKQAVEIVNSPHFRRYNRVAVEITRGQPDWREQIDIGSELPPVPRKPDTPAWAPLQGPNQWPSTLPELKPVSLSWQAEATAVVVRLLRYFALAMGQPQNAFESLHAGEPHLLIKLIHYPGRQSTADDQGVGAHKDAGLLSLLLQDQVSGLQVQNGDGWIDATPIPGTLVVNIDELLELASDGYLRATVHRVTTPPAGSERLPAAFFLGARLDATVPLLRLPPDATIPTCWRPARRNKSLPAIERLRS